MMPGLLMAAKGDRSTRFSATEGRYPFLDERVVEFCAGLAPHYKLRRWTDKYLLRRVAGRVLPPPIAKRPKTMFRANLGRAFVAAGSAALGRSVAQRRIAEGDGLFRSAGGGMGTATSAKEAVGVAATLLVGHGLDGRHLHAAVAPYVLRRRTV